jgi:hypothetical protein
MTRIEVGAETITALGGVLVDVADDLRWQARRGDEQVWALGPGDSGAALASVLGDFEHQRQVLGRELDELAARARQAGRLYADVELDVRTAVGGSGAAREVSAGPGASGVG